MQHSSGFIDLISELKHTVKEKDVTQVKQELDSSKALVLIDVRETDEWDDGYIPGAIHLSKGILERDIEKIVPDKSSEIILYCRGGYRSMISADAIQKMGYNNVSSMTGGIIAWEQAGYDITDD